MTFKGAKEKVAQLPYVAPVTPDTLPAEEVLVRGTQEPQAGRETLVRAATPTLEETAQQENARTQQVADDRSLFIRFSFERRFAP